MDHAMIVKSKRKFPNLAYLSTLLLLCFSFPTITAFPVSRQIRGPRQIKIYAVDADSSTAAESIEGRSDDDKDVVIAEGIRPPTQLARMSDRTIAATDSIEGKSDNDKDVVRTEAIQSSSKSSRMPDRKIDLMFCDGDICRDAIRQRVIGKHNQIVLQGPATGQVAYRWDQKTPSKSSKAERSDTTISSVLLLVRPNDQVLIKKAAEVVPKITHMGIKVLLVPELAAKLKYYYGVDDDRIALFEEDSGTRRRKEHYVDDSEDEWVQDMDLEPFPDLVCTLGGDGLLMHASMMFQGPVPPIMSIAGGSLGFLTPFAENEMEDAICIALGMEVEQNEELSNSETDEITVFPPNMEYPYDPPHLLDTTRATFGMADYVCITIRMRLDCRIVSPEGLVRSRFNVLNEVVIDRGSSPYLAALECFCDDVHLTTVQADGVIFAT
jgi:NAD kinase